MNRKLVRPLAEGSTEPVRPRRGDIWRVEFDPSKGDEIAKLRPAVVVSSDAVGKLAIKIVVPVTTWQEKFTDNIWMVKLEPDETNGLTNISTADALQVRSLSIERFVEKLGRVSPEILDDILAAIVIVIEY